MPDQRRTSTSMPNLCDPGQAEDHLRLLVERRHLSSPTMLLACGDATGHPLFHLHVVECDLDPTPSECTVVLDRLLDRVEEIVAQPVQGLVLGLTRPGGESVQDYDRTWFRALHRICHQRGVAPWGVYVLNRHGTRSVHIDDAA